MGQSETSRPNIRHGKFLLNRGRRSQWYRHSRNVPLPLMAWKIPFLTAVAIVDDIGAITVVAIF
jgi:hypothetical protein